MITLPKTDLQVHPLCLGGNVFGFSADIENSEKVLSYYFDNGGNFVDTADMYSHGHQVMLVESRRPSSEIG